jgi:hypothetical protein
MRPYLRFAEHLHGKVILEHAFPQQFAELTKALGATDIPLRAAEPFTPTGRPMTPKRQKKSFQGQERLALMPIDQSAWNDQIAKALRDELWNEQPVANESEGMQGANLKGDFVKNRVFVEVEFGNVASVHRDFFKFQIASRARTGDVAVLVVATARVANLIDQNVATFEYLLSLREYLSIGIQMPICIIGLDVPEGAVGLPDWGDIYARYVEMYKVATQNGLECHPFEVASRAPLDAMSDRR